MKQTPNINLPILEQGDKYLKETQNEAFSVIDREIAGLNSAISVLDNVEGSIIDTKSDVEALKNETNALKASLNYVSSNVIPNIQTSLDNIAINPKNYGAIGDGSLHLVSEKFSNVNSAIECFGFNVELNDSLDWACIQYCLNNFTNVMLPEGEYIINKPLYIRSLTTLRGVNKGKVEIRKITNDMFVPNTFNRYSKLMGFDFNDDFMQDSLLICYHDNDKPSQSVTISNLSLKGITSEQDVNYAIYCPMSSQLTIDNVITRNFKTSFYTNDSWTVKFNNYEIKYSDYGVVFEVSPLNTGHYWCGTSIDSNNLVLTECKNGIKLTHVAYSSFNTITYDNSNNVGTVLELSNCNGIIINALGVEHVKINNSLFKILNNCRGITINNLTFESSVFGSDNINTEIFKLEKSKLILNNPSLTLSAFNNSSTFNVSNNSVLVFNDGNDFDYRKGQIDDTSKVIKNTNNIFTTTSDLIIDVDLSNGNDIVGTGYSENPFKTIKKALSIIPSVINHDITIRIAGNHTDTIKLNGLTGSGKITIDKISGRGCEIIALNCIDIKNCIVPIYINNIQFNSNNNSNAIAITLENNNRVSFNNCNVVNNQYRTVYCDNTNLSYENSQLTCGERLFDIRNMSNVFLGSLSFREIKKITVNSSILYTYLTDVTGVEKYRGGQMFSE